MPAYPSYRSLTSDEWRARVARAVAMLGECRACPRDCGVNRLADHWAACRTGRHAVVASAFTHRGEEDCLRGWRGSGTIFFAHCNLRCVFCQNADISQEMKPREPEGSPASTIAALMLGLQARGCHNINLVTPEHVVPQVVESLADAAARALTIPLVYNTGGYDALDSIALLDGLVDIYMPDFKFWSSDASARYLKAGDYPDAARAAIKAMHEQVGPLAIDERGLATRGVLIRHLVMPGHLHETRALLEWIAGELGPGADVNVMDQYHPAGRVLGGRYPELARRVAPDEYSEACRIARDLGLRLDSRTRWD